MSDDRLANARWRLDQPLPPSTDFNDVTDAERARFRRYVDAEVAARRHAPACPPDDLLEAVHASAFRLEHGAPADAHAELAHAASLVRAPLDGKTRDFLARLAFAAAGGGDPRDVTEQIRAEFADWPCLTDAKHQRFHQRLR
jgi:hypothetical protein